MKSFSNILLFLALIFILATGCAAPPVEKSVKYPRKQVDGSERKSGPVMLLYDAAEEDADPNNVIVIPPSEKKKSRNN